jgi:hypothetical protein
MKYEVGQKVWYVPRERRFEKPHEAEITKIGRKWASFGQGSRFDIETGCVDGSGYITPGRIYQSEAAWREEQELFHAWSNLRRRIERYSEPPNSLTVDKIRQAREILGIPEGKKCS